MSSFASSFASTSAFTLDDVTVTITPEPSTTTSTVTLTLTETLEEPTTVTLTALPTATTASFYSALSLNSSAFERASNASATTVVRSAVRTGAYPSGSGYYAVSGSAAAATHSAANATMVSAASAIRTAILATVITSDELTQAAPNATATSFRSHIGTTIYSHSSASHKLVTESSAASSSAKSSSAVKAIKTASSSSKKTTSKSSSRAKAATTTTTRSTSTTAAPVVSSASSSPRVFGNSSSSQAKAVVTSTSSASAAATLFASAAVVATSSSSSSAGPATIYATPASSSHSAAASSTALAQGSASGATRSSNVSTFFSSLGNSPGSIVGTVVVAVAICAVVTGLLWLLVRLYRTRRARHVQLGSDAGSPDLDSNGDDDEKSLRPGPRYKASDEEAAAAAAAAVQPEAIWARRLSQLQLSLVGGPLGSEDDDDSPVVGYAHSHDRSASSEWTPSGNKLSVAQNLRQSRRMSPRGSTPPPPPPAMALPQLPVSAHLAVPRAAHPLRESTTAGLARSPSMYSGDEDDRRSVESAGKQVLLGGAAVAEEAVQAPAQPGSWKDSLDQVMSSTADFLLGRQASTDLEAQTDKYTVFRSQSVNVRRSPVTQSPDSTPDSTPEMSELGYVAAPTKTWAGRGRANTLSGLSSDEQHKRNVAGLGLQGASAKAVRAGRAPAKQLMLPLIVEERREADHDASAAVDPFADPEPSTTPLEQLSAMLELGLGDLFTQDDSETSTLHRASTATSPVARSPARLVTLSRSGTGFKSQAANMDRSRSDDSTGSDHTATPLVAGARLSTASTARRASVDGSETGASGWEGEEGETDDGASIATFDSQQEFNRRASILMTERRRRSEGYALGPRVVPGTEV